MQKHISVCLGLISDLSGECGNWRGGEGRNKHQSEVFSGPDVPCVFSFNLASNAVG